MGLHHQENRRGTVRQLLNCDSAVCSTSTAVEGGLQPMAPVHRLSLPLLIYTIHRQ